MVMNRKDRIAVVVSIIYFSVALLIAFKLTGFDILKALLSQVMFAAPVFLYWGYRFIQNDISFLRVKDE
jgi:hypothetical protein